MIVDSGIVPVSLTNLLTNLFSVFFYTVVYHMMNQLFGIVSGDLGGWVRGNHLLKWVKFSLY